jgi:uncharacterized protein YndB with AHSA1/START domain
MPTITSAITIRATAERVFDTLTRPGLMELWQHGRVVTTDWKAGSKIRFRTEWAEGSIEQWGMILEVKANVLLKYNLFTPKPGIEDSIENYCTTSYVLTADNGQTKLEIIQEDNRPNAFNPGTLMPILVSLKKVAESN